jgi:hypothetical protein
MKKLLLSISIISLFAGAGKAQMPLTVGHQWTKAFPSASIGIQTEQAGSAVTPDGHLISATNYRYAVDADPNPNSTVVVTGASNYYNGIITILDQNENYFAHLNFANTTTDTKIVSVVTDSENNIYVLGYSSANITLGTVNPITVTITGSAGNYFVAKLNTSGVPLWAYTTNRTMAQTKFNTIAVGDVNGSNRLFVGGYSTSGFNTDIKSGSGSAWFNPGGASGYPLIISYDTDCNYVTYNYMNVSANSGGIIASIVLKSNNLYLTGVFSGNLQIPPISINIATKGAYDVFVAKYNAIDLQPTWAGRLGSNNNDYSKDIAVDDNENVYVTGEFEGSGFNFDPAAAGTSLASGQNIFLTKLNSSGVFVWGRHFYGGTSTGEFVNSIAVTGTGDVFMTGQIRLRVTVEDHIGNNITTINPSALNNNNALDIFLYRLNSSGGIEMTTHFGGSGSTAGSSSYLTNYEKGVDLNIHNGNLYLSANTTILRNFNAENIDFNPAPFTFGGLGDYLSNTNQESTATLTKYYVCTDNSSAGFPSSVVGTCPNQFLQYVASPNSPDLTYQWNCAVLGINSDSAILNIANPSVAYGGKIMNLQITDTNGCYKHLSAPIDGSGLSAASVSITATATDLCNGNDYTFTSTGTDVKWYANAMDTIPLTSGNTYTYTPLLQQTTPMAIYAATTNTLTGCEEPRALHSFTVGVVPQPQLDLNPGATGPLVGCADGQPRYLNVFTSVKIFADSLSITEIGSTSSWWDLGSHYNMSTPDTITVWIEGQGYIGPTNSIPCESIRYPVSFILNDCSIGINEDTDLSSMLKVYPNPVKNILSIESKLSSTISIVNLLGTIVGTTEVNFGNNKLDVSNLAPGVYFIQTPNGDFSKFVKE